jgi:energy-coupling factor transport system ATP-binding protein
VEHKIDQVLDYIDRVIVFNPDGEIIADGNAHYVFSTNKEILREYGIWYPGVWDNFSLHREKNKTLTSPSTVQNQLHLENFKSYRKKEVMISIEEISASSGDWVTVIGENGAGKSTLLLALMQLLKTTGTYQINRKQVKGIKNLEDVAYFVFQNPEYQFVTNTVFDEVAFALKHKKADKKVILERVTELLTTFGLNEKQHHHPYHLSLGQKRRLSVATAFVMNPQILLLDEPTFGQDSKNTFRLLELLEKERQKGTIILMVTHDFSIVKNYATKVWKVHDRIVENVDCISKEETYV